MTGETFGQLLRRVRAERGFSQNELARQAGIDPAYVNRLERLGPGRMLGRQIALALAMALEMSYAERDRFLFTAGLSPETDWQARCEDAEAALQSVRDALGLVPDAAAPTVLRRRTG
jgi:transcriptional regulator with XRE-family HTH domain